MTDFLSRGILVASLTANVFAAGVLLRAVYVRGGWSYLRDRFSSPASSWSRNSDETVFLHRQSQFELLPARQHPLVFLGDSLTADFEWGEVFPSAVNRGIGGDTSAGILRRLSSITRMNPQAVFLMIGSNDAANAHLTPEKSFANIKSIVAELRRTCPHSRVYLQSVLPAGDTPGTNYIRELNRMLPSLADGDSVFYIDFFDSFLAGRLLNPAFSADGNHLNGEGYQVWVRAIQKYALID